MISAQTRSAFVARENRYTFFRIMLWPQKRADATKRPPFCVSLFLFLFTRVRTYLLRHQFTWRLDLFGHLTADFPARIGCGVNVDVVLARREVGGLRIGERGAAFDRARRR